MTVNFFGDSITVGNGVTTAQSYPYIFATTIGQSYNNYAVNGSMAADQSWKNQTVTPSDISVFNLGVNDSWHYGTSAQKRAAFIKFLRSLVVCQLSPDYINARSMSKTGPWTNVPASTGDYLGCFTDVSGSTATASVRGKSIYVHYLLQSQPTSESVFNIYVDNVLKDTITLDGVAVGNTYLGKDYSNACVRVSGLSDGLHTVKVESISGNRLFLEGVSGSFQNSKKVGYVSNIIKSTAAYYALRGNGNGVPNITLYNTDIQTMVDELTLDGFMVKVFDSFSVIDPDTETHDGLHPNSAGHTDIANKLLEVFYSGFQFGSGSGPCTPVPCAPLNGHVTMTGKNLDLLYSAGVLQSVTIT